MYRYFAASKDDYNKIKRTVNLLKIKTFIFDVTIDYEPISLTISSDNDDFTVIDLTKMDDVAIEKFKEFLNNVIVLRTSLNSNQLRYDLLYAKFQYGVNVCVTEQTNPYHAW